MSRKYNTIGRQFPNSLQYNKVHVFEEIQELYQVYRLTYGDKPIKFVRGRGSENNYKSDYGLCAAVIAEAQKLTDMGAGRVGFTAIVDKEARKNDGYSYRVYTDRNWHGADSDPCRSNSGSSYACGSGN